MIVLVQLLKMIAVFAHQVIVVMMPTAIRIVLVSVSVILKLMSVMYAAEIIQAAQTVTALQMVMQSLIVAEYAQAVYQTMRQTVI